MARMVRRRTNNEAIEDLVRMVGDSRYSRRDLAKRAAALGLAAPAVGLAARGAWRASAQGTEPAGKLIVSMSVEPDTLENWKAYSTDGHPILRNVQEALLNRDPVTNELVGELATAWEQTDDRTWRFTLRQGVTFHNGDPFNAEVAAYGTNYTWSPENEFEIYQFIGPDITATAVDEYTLDVSDGRAGPDPAVAPLLRADPEHDPGARPAGYPHHRADRHRAVLIRRVEPGPVHLHHRLPGLVGTDGRGRSRHDHHQGRRVRLPGGIPRARRPGQRRRGPDRALPGAGGLRDDAGLRLRALGRDDLPASGHEPSGDERYPRPPGDRVRGRQAGDRR